MESGNDYVIQVKGNQLRLLEAIKQTIRTTDSIDMDYTYEKNRGRVEEREVYVFNQLDDPLYNEWRGIKKIIQIVSQGTRNKKKYLVIRYYITSRSDEDAKVYNKGIREHWGIENGLHWVKDVILKEDRSMVRDMDRSGNMSVIRNIIINIFKVHGYKSTKYAIEECTNKITKCIGLICEKITYE